ncbi:hypothetical protein SAMN04490243_2028 [Robiginitalea myxolifaciens]|uniref:Septum formation inhibitor Maf n=1 Tax=Robiginitalea myxolifaciens TaxID=400055 RepID=A0A1I6H0Y3_9FLAO|nr:septum formation inhibitor Maf [Robiginitalea myxolifaciens]SFR48110.1 hypothetical protein SAMN04490243_2028 [Robiginitalea myxolifaciens]
MRLNYLIPVIILALFWNCTETPEQSEVVDAPEEAAAKPFPLSAEFRSYWYAGQAELTSYELSQARYGELRDGEAVLIYVTEPFDPVKQVKDDRTDSSTVSVLKLNRTKKFLTGLYPYSIMSSIFYPVGDHMGASKISTSVQEWCGHVYTQLNRRDSLQVIGHSYFESEGEQDFKLPLEITEDELWMRLRIAPERLPLGELRAVPSLEYLRLKHQPIRAYTVQATLSDPGAQRTYTLTYPELNRTLQIHFEGEFPYGIKGWSETYPDGFGAGAKMLTTTATRKNRLLTPYWTKNSNADVILRDSLGLD